MEIIWQPSIACSCHVDAFWILEFKMFYFSSHKSNWKSAFTVDFVVTRSSKLNPILICFDNIFFWPKLPDYSHLVTRYCQVGCKIKIKWLPGYLNFFTHQRKSFHDGISYFTCFWMTQILTIWCVNHGYVKKTHKIYLVTRYYLGGKC